MLVMEMSRKEQQIPAIRFNGFADDWEQRKLGDITTKIGSGKTPKGGNSVYVESGVPLLRSQNIYNDIVNFEEIAYITESMDKEMANSRVEKDDVLLNITGASIGRAAVYELSSPSNVNQHVCIIRPINEINSHYIQLNLTSPKGQKQIELNQAGGGREGLNFQQIAKMDFKYPTFKEQTKLGIFFKQLDDTIALHQRKLTLFNQLKETYLKQMFPQNEENMPVLRFADFSEPWEQRKLGDTVQITMGQSPNGENYTDNPRDHILVQGNADMKNGRVCPRVWTTQVTKKADPEDIILSVRAPVGDVGRTDYTVVLGRGVAGIKGNAFIFQTLSRMKEQGFWTRYSSGSTFESINSADLKDAFIQICHIEEQTKIGDFFTKLDDTIALHQSKLQKLAELKKTLLAKMLV